MNKTFESRLAALRARHEELVSTPNAQLFDDGGAFVRYKRPVLTADHVPLDWRYDLSPERNPLLLERLGIEAAFNAGAIRFNGRHCVVARVEGADRKSFFAVAESENGVDNFRFRPEPITMPEWGEPATNVYDMRLTAHEDGWIYGIFCVERHDPAHPEDLSAAVAAAGIARTKDLDNWERLPDLECACQQRNVVLHPEFVDGKYALYTRPQDGFIDAGSGGGIGWALVDDIAHATVGDQRIIDARAYHTIKEVKNGEGPAPIKTAKGWLHLAHGVRGTAAGLRYVLYLYLTALDDPARVIAAPGGAVMVPRDDERVGDVSNVLFSNGWTIEPSGRILLYYASSDTRLHVAESSVERLLDWCLGTPPDRGRTGLSVEDRIALIRRNRGLL